ncbi:hypothetical protein E6W17_00750 [Streptomyces sp. A1547]|nr:hypothetical protein E6W17_00750 [Streptomyces sp. A1547]
MSGTPMFETVNNTCKSGQRQSPDPPDTPGPAGVRGAGVRGAGVRGAGVRGAGVRGAGVRGAGVRQRRPDRHSIREGP